MSYDDWLGFIFDHEIEDIPVAWHFKKEYAYQCSGHAAISNLTRLFNTSGYLTSRFSLRQIDQGMWFIPGPNGLMWAILDKGVSLDLRRQCIEAIASLCRDLLCAHAQLNVSSYMWWDSLFTYCTLNGRNLATESEVLEVVVNTMSQIWCEGCLSSRQSVRHGVEHLLEMCRSTNSSVVHGIVANRFDLSSHQGLENCIDDPFFGGG